MTIRVFVNAAENALSSTCMVTQAPVIMPGT